MNNTPFQNGLIKEPDNLYGRADLLDDLLNIANTLTPIQLIGARRFGKSCTINSFSTKLKRLKDAISYPIILDTYSDDIVGAEYTYRYIAANIISQLLSDGIIDDTDIFLEDILVTISPKTRWKIINEQILASRHDAAEIFEAIVINLSSRIGKKLLLIFDEYEHMAREAFDVKGFRPMRRICDQQDSPIFFWLVGANKWEIFAAQDPKHTIGGSGEFNQVQAERFVVPLKKADFCKMWEHECSNIANDSIRRMALESRDNAFISSGGVPFYAKTIGKHIIFDKSFPTYSILEGQLFELEKNLSSDAKKMLYSIQRKPIEEPEVNPNSINTLKSLGLLIKNSHNQLSIPIKYLSDYIASKIADDNSSDESTNNLLQIVDSIGELIVRINNNQISKNGRPLIPARVDAYTLYKYLRTPADSQDKFTNFINSMYVLYWDNSKAELYSNGYKLAYASMFRKSMDRIRHIYGIAHEGENLDVAPGQISIENALQYISGFPIVPKSSQDFLTLQFSLLNHFMADLVRINQKIENDLRTRTNK